MYVKVTNGTPTPYTIGQLRRDNQNTSFPKNISEETLAAFDVYPATVEELPDFNKRTQNIERSRTAIQVDGQWVYQWILTDKTADEIAQYDAQQGNHVRALRDKRLAQTDYLALSDNTLTEAMATYRQALRDITDHANFPYLTEEDWPTKPE